MTRIAIVGANGQVGAEVSIRLRAAKGVGVVPIARNPSGSAFLRLNGMDCRHGRIADADDARRLIGDCDVVVSFALSTTGIPRADREANRNILRGLVAGAKPGAPIIFASTIMVYAPDMQFRFPDAYGLEKLSAERTLSRLCRAERNPLYVFRLGHVLGELQNITRKIKGEIANGKVALPRQGMLASNTVFTSTIVEAVLQVAGGAQRPGTYDLITWPQWNWLEVYKYYAAQLGLPLVVADAEEVRASAAPASLLRRWMTYLRQNHWLRARLMFLLGYASPELNQKIYLRYLQTRASSEIDALRQSQKLDLCAPDWRELNVQAMPQLPDPPTCESRYPLQCIIDHGVAEHRQALPQSLP